MEYGICNLSVIPLRAETDDRSEQVSQVLFGETFEIMEWKDNWVKIITTLDSYPGWIGRLQFKMLGHLAYKRNKQTRPRITHHPVTQIWKIANNSILYLPMGSSLSFLKGTTCNIGDEQFEIIGELFENESLANSAMSFLNTPYLWGGRTHFGIDCSGFTQAVFRTQGITLPRDARMQVEQGKVVNAIHGFQLGDLAFFENNEGKIVHVGIMLNNERIIHASGKVKIDTIDENGIYSGDQKKYTHKLTVVKRFF